MSVDLNNYVGMYNSTPIADKQGTEIDYVYWNNLFESLRVQGNYSTDTLVAIIARLLAGVWHTLNGAASIKKPPINDGNEQSLDTVSDQIDFLAERVAALLPLTSSTGAYNVPYDTSTVGDTLEALQAQQDNFEATATTIHNNMGRRDAADCHPIAAITGLAEKLTALATGHVSAYPHNLLPGRGAIGAHPISAIDGLDAELERIDDRGRTGSEVFVHDNTSAVMTLQALLDNLYTLLSAATGAATLYHAALLGRDVADAHPISSITGLSARLNDTYTKAEVDALFQTKIITYTGDTPPTGLPDGTICLRLE